MRMLLVVALLAASGGPALAEGTGPKALRGFRLEALPGTRSSAHHFVPVKLGDVTHHVPSFLHPKLIAPPSAPGGLEAIADKMGFGSKIRVSLDPTYLADEGGAVSAEMRF